MSDNRQFSKRENEVIELLLQGKSNKQIAQTLVVSARTVEYHLKNVYKKTSSKLQNRSSSAIGEIHR
jgi:LuxR family maltose regulon positive regulatory protein